MPFDYEEQQKRTKQRREALYRTLGTRPDGSSQPRSGYQPNPNIEFQPSPTSPTVNNHQSAQPKDPSKKSSLLDTLKSFSSKTLTSALEQRKEILKPLNDGFQAKDILDIGKNIVNNPLNPMKSVVQPVVGGAVGLGPKGDKYGVWDGVQNFNQSFNQNFVAGVGDVVEGTGKSLTYLGDKFDQEGLQKAGKATAQFGHKNLIEGFEKPYEKEFTWRSMFDPDFYASDVARSVPFMLSMILPAVGGATALGKAGSVLANASKFGNFGKSVIRATATGVGGAAATAPIEALFEASDVYDQAIQKGMNPEEAEAAADGVFKKNLALLGVSNAVEFATMFAPGTKGMLGKVGAIAGSAVMEGGQEVAQELISAKALDEKRSSQELWKAGAIGGLMGGGMAAITSKIGDSDPIATIKSNVEQQMSDESREEMDHLREKMKTEGYSPEEIEEAVHEVFAETEEGQLLINQETQRLVEKLQGDQKAPVSPTEVSYELPGEEPAPSHPQASGKNLHDAMYDAVMGTAKKQVDEQNPNLYEEVKKFYLEGNTALGAIRKQFNLKHLSDAANFVDRIKAEQPQEEVKQEAEAPLMSQEELKAIIEQPEQPKVEPKKIDKGPNSINPEFGYADPFADETFGTEPKAEEPSVQSVPEQRRKEHEAVRKQQAEKEKAKQLRMDKLQEMVHQHEMSGTTNESRYHQAKKELTDLRNGGDFEFTSTESVEAPKISKEEFEKQQAERDKENKIYLKHQKEKEDLRDRELGSLYNQIAKAEAMGATNAPYYAQAKARVKELKAGADPEGWEEYLADEEESKPKAEPSSNFRTKEERDEIDKKIKQATEETKKRYAAKNDEEILDEVAHDWLRMTGGRGNVDRALEAGNKQAALAAYKTAISNSGGADPGGLKFGKFGKQLSVETSDGRSWNPTPEQLFNRYLKQVEAANPKEEGKTEEPKQSESAQKETEKPKSPEGFKNGYTYDEFQKGEEIYFFSMERNPKWTKGTVAKIVKAKNAQGKDVIRQVHVTNSDQKGESHFVTVSQIAENLYKKVAESNKGEKQEETLTDEPNTPSLKLPKNVENLLKKLGAKNARDFNMTKTPKVGQVVAHRDLATKVKEDFKNQFNTNYILLNEMEFPKGIQFATTHEQQVLVVDRIVKDLNLEKILTGVDNKNDMSTLMKHAAIGYGGKQGDDFYFWVSVEQGEIAADVNVSVKNPKGGRTVYGFPAWNLRKFYADYGHTVKDVKARAEKATKPPSEFLFSEETIEGQNVLVIEAAFPRFGGIRDVATFGSDLNKGGLKQGVDWAYDGYRIVMMRNDKSEKVWKELKQEHEGSTEKVEAKPTHSIEDRKYFSLSPNPADIQAIAKAQPSNILLAYDKWGKIKKKDGTFNHRDYKTWKSVSDLVKGIGYTPKSIILDSGAFAFKDNDSVYGPIEEAFGEFYSLLDREEIGFIVDEQIKQMAHTGKISHDLDELEEFDINSDAWEEPNEFIRYADWVRQQKTGLNSDVYVMSFDKIGDPDLSWSTYNLLAGVFENVIPTYHYGSDIKYLEQYINDGADYIALGGSAYLSLEGKEGHQKRIDWAKGLVKKYPNIKFHMLGTMSKDMMDQVPNLYSLDGSGWVDKTKGQTNEEKINNSAAKVKDIQNHGSAEKPIYKANDRVVFTRGIDPNAPKGTEGIVKRVYQSGDMEIQVPGVNYRIKTAPKDVERASEIQTEEKPVQEKTVLPLPEDANQVDPKHFKEYTQVMKKVIDAYRAAIGSKRLPTTQKELRAMAAGHLGRQPLEDEWSDALETAIQLEHLNNKFKQRNQTTGTFTWSLPEAIENGQKLETHLKNAGRSLEKTERQQFSTPIPLAEIVSFLTNVKPNHLVRESSAGTGSLIIPLLQSMSSPKGIFVNELSPRRAAILEVVAREAKDPIRANETKETKTQTITIQNGNAFELPSDTKYDVIVGNPPFKGENLGKGSAAFNGKPPWKGGWGDLGNRFLAWDLRSLKEGGRLVYVVGGNVIDGQQNAEFRKWLKSNHTVRAMVKFPGDVYDSRGTKFPTGLIVVEKGKTGEQETSITGQYETMNDLLTALRPLIYPYEVGDTVLHKSQFEPWRAEILEFEPNFKHSGKVQYDVKIRTNGGNEMVVNLNQFVPKEDEADYLASKEGKVFPKNGNVPKDAQEMLEDWQQADGVTNKSIPPKESTKPKKDIDNTLNEFFGGGKPSKEQIKKALTERLYDAGMTPKEAVKEYEANPSDFSWKPEQVEALYEMAGVTPKPTQVPPKNVVPTKKEEITQKYDKVRDNLSWLDNLADKADDYIKKNKDRMNALPVDLFGAAAIVGARKIAHGVVDFAEWSEQMLNEYGKGLRLYLRALYAQSEDVLNMSREDVEEMLRESGTNLTMPEETPTETKDEEEQGFFDQEFELEFKQEMEQHIQYLKDSQAKGVEQGGVVKNEFGEVTSRYGRISKNPQWYQEFYSIHKRKPNKSELEGLAQRHLLNGFGDEFGNIEPWEPQIISKIQDDITGLEELLSVDENPETEELLKDAKQDLSRAEKAFNEFKKKMTEKKEVKKDGVAPNKSDRNHAGTGNRHKDGSMGTNQPGASTGSETSKRTNHRGPEGVSSTGSLHEQEPSSRLDGANDGAASSFTSEQEAISAEVPTKVEKPNKRDTGGTKAKGTDGSTPNHVSSPHGYVPGRVVTGVAHRGNVTEAPNMRFVKLPEDIYKDDKYLPHPKVVNGGEWKLSDVQMESVMAAKYNFLERGKRGILIADDTGMGKTAQQLGIAGDAWHSGRTKRILVITTKDQVATQSFIPENEKLGLELPITWIGPESDYVKKHGTNFKDKAHKEADDYLPFQVGDGVIVMSKYTFRDSQESVIKWLAESKTDVTILMDESHEFANREAGLGKANVRIYNQFKDKAQFIYSSATAAENIEGLEHMYGLHLWGTDGFGAFQLRLTSADTKQKSGGKRKTGMAAAFDKSGKSPFKREVPLTMMEQITRELKMEGQYIGRQLSMEGVAMEGLEVKLSPKDVGDWNRAVKFVGMIAQKAEMYGRSKDGSLNPKARGMITSQVVGYMKRLSGYYRLKAIIADIQKQMEEGTFTRFGIMAEFKSGDDGEPANLMAAIHAINDQDPVDDGDDITYTDIPEALDDKAELMAILKGLNPEWGEKPVPEIPSPMEMLFDAFGEEAVAIVSGDVSAKNRPKVVKDFQNGSKPIIWFNAAGGTGVNMHDTIGVPIRVYTQDYPYNAKQQKQAEGRFNRTGQVTKPMYVYPYLNSSTDTKFVGTLIARYEAMGALSRGDTGKLGGAELASFDFTGEAAEEAVYRTIPDIDADDRATMFGEFTREQSYISEGGAIDDTSVRSTFSGDAPEVKKFLNALMFLEFDSSNRVFQIFQEKMAEVEREMEEKGGVKDKFETYSGEELDAQVGKNGIKLRKIRTILTEQQQKSLDYNLQTAIENEEAMKVNYEVVKDDVLHKLEGQVEEIERKQKEEKAKQKELENKRHELHKKVIVGEIGNEEYQKHITKITTLIGEIRRREDRLNEVKGKLKGLKDGNDDIIDTIADMKQAKTRMNNARLFRMGAESDIERSQDVLLVDGKIATNGLLVNIRSAIRVAAKKIYGEHTPAAALTLELRGYTLKNNERAIGAVVPKWAEAEVANALEARMAYSGGSDDIAQLKTFLKAGNKVSLQGGYELEWQPRLGQFRIGGMTVSKDRDLFKTLNKDGPMVGFDPVSKSFILDKDEAFQKFIERFPILEKKMKNEPPKPPSVPSTPPGDRTIKGLNVTVTTSKHTQTGEPIWLVKVLDRIENYGEFSGFMKRHGGTYYSAKTKIAEFRGHFVFTRDPEPVFDKNIHKELTDRINERIPSGEELGFVNMPFGRLKAADTSRPYAIENAERRKRVDDAETIPKEPLLKKIKAYLEEKTNQLTREYEHLPNTGFFSPIRHKLLNLEKQRGVKMEETARNLQSLLIDLDKNQYELYRNVVLLSDMMKEKESGHALAFGFTEEELDYEHGRMMDFLAKEPVVQESINLRKRLWEDIKKNYVKAFSSIGVDVADKFTKEDYYRHIVIEKAIENGKDQLATNKKLQTPHGKGYMKQRKGSELDYVTDYLLAESEVMANMLFDIEVAKTVEMVDTKYNIHKSLKKEQEDANERDYQALKELEIKEQERKIELEAQGLSEDEIEEVAEREQLGLPERAKNILARYVTDYKLRLGKSHATMIDAVEAAIRGRVGWGHAELTKLAESDGLWAGVDGEYEYLVERLASGLEIGKEGWFQYLSDLAGVDHEGAKWAGMILKYIHLPKHLKRDLLGDGYHHLTIPETHAVWHPKDANIFAMANTLPEHLAERLFNGTLDTLTEGDFIKQLTLVGRREGFIIPVELKATLENLMEPRKFGTFKLAMQKLKQLYLIGPVNLFKYNARNLTGDLDKTITGNPGALNPKILNRAGTELNQMFIKNRAPGPELKAWLERGGVQTLLQSQEFGEIRHLHIFKNKLMEKEMSTMQKFFNLPKKSWDLYWNLARKMTDHREALLRYANFLSYLEQVEKGNGTPKNYGSSIRAEIDALESNYDKAFNLSNDLLIAYDKTSAKGRELRDTWVPFQSFVEGNMRSYIRLAKNAYQDEQLSQAVGRKLLGAVALKSPVLAYRTGKLAMKLTFMTTLLALWNTLVMGDEDDELPDHVKNTVHITLGRNSDGEVVYFNRLGTLEDFLGWFGLDNVDQDLVDIMNNDRTFLEVIGANTLRVVNKAVNSLNPIGKQAAEQIAGIKVFPDFTKPTRIHDRWAHFASLFSAQKEYEAMRDTMIGRPHKEHKALAGWVAYTNNADETNYYKVRDRVAKDAKKYLGKHTSTMLGKKSPKSDALYEVKVGLKFGDLDWAEQHLQEYYALGGTSRGLKQSLNFLHPLNMIPKDLRQKYYDSLDPAEQERIEQAVEYYKRVLLADTNVTE